MANTNGQEWLRLHTWAVAGDVLNEAKYAHTIAETLQKEGYEVVLVNPRSRDPRLCRALSDYGQPIDVLDLVIHPKLGLKLVEEAYALGIKRVLIQPGAESEAILTYCAEHGLEAIEGCVLRALAGEG